MICNSKTAAMGVLETIAGTFKRGTQKDAIIAVINWINENYPRDFDEETKNNIQRIYDEVFDDGGKNFINWQVHGGEPKHGTRAKVNFLFNAEKKIWELESEMPPVWVEENPNIIPQEDYSDEESQ